MHQVVWIPAHCVTYGVVPPHLRMPWIAMLSFGYVSLLSATRGDYGGEDTAAAAVGGRPEQGEKGLPSAGARPLD